ncbi:hexapeptide transferase [Marinilabiliaceae bacterium A049]|nr:hexapeptide transferase [Marinilabiliaceae bacterium A049]
MKFVNRTIYLFYYLKNEDFGLIRKFLNYAKKLTGRTKSALLVDMIVCVYKYNISLKDYFYFRFFEIDTNERKKWVGTGFMYEFQLKMNPKNNRKVLEDKIQFLGKYSSYVRRKVLTYRQAFNDKEKLNQIFNNKSGKLVLKGSLGQVGAEVKVIKCDDYNADSLLHFMMQNKFDLIEEYVIQHPMLMQLSDSGLNTIRIFTQLNNGEVDILGARLRITVNSEVDNMAAGNLAAPIDVINGSVSGPGVYSDITKEDVSIHPVSNESIEGFKIPFWSETIELVTKAALSNSSNQSIGWDIAISEYGPELIEGNHNWCKLLWQLPVKKGLKDKLLKYM